MVLRILVLGAVAAALTAPAERASATPITTKKAIWGPVERGGLSQFPIYADLGAGIYQITVNWSEVAPTRPHLASDPDDPGYSWPAAVDQAIEQAAPYGIRVMVML